MATGYVHVSGRWGSGDVDSGRSGWPLWPRSRCRQWRRPIRSTPARRRARDLTCSTRKPVTAPQLQNASLFDARPILISGTSAYRQGEFLYQDFIYDDHGAQASSRAPNDPRSGTDSFSAPNGTYIYPTDPAYAGNAADFVELRVKPRPSATAFRITLNTLTDPESVGITIAIGGDPGAPVPFPARRQRPGPRRVLPHRSRG
jgi:hypothetical protein